jgi:hypothetical protein
MLWALATFATKPDGMALPIKSKRLQNIEPENIEPDFNLGPYGRSH